jgi:cell division protease FtsH
MIFSPYCFSLLLIVPTYSFAFFNQMTHKTDTLLFSQKKYYPFSKKYHKGYLYLNNLNRTTDPNGNNNDNKYTPLPSSQEEDAFDFEYIEKILKGLTGQKKTIIIQQPFYLKKQNIPLFNNNDDYNDENDEFDDQTQKKVFFPSNNEFRKERFLKQRQFKNNNDENEEDDENVMDSFEKIKKQKNSKSENFEVIKKFPTKFKDIGGYANIKMELMQCIDLMCNYKKYSKYNLRVPKGLIFEGPPGNGKTLFAKALAGESNVGFISVSGSEFNEKYVGVGASRIRELFQLAKKNIPCIVFIDEIDALGRKRSGDGEQSTAEKDSTLNELLIALDGFKNISGIFVIGATNRIDLLDPALVRPGRIDKHIYIGNPDTITRTHILNIHIQGKPYNSTDISITDLTEFTAGLSCAQIENLLNESLLYALLNKREQIEKNDVDFIMSKIMTGWMATPHQFTDDMLFKIMVHEMGHVITGLSFKNHPKVSKVVVNLYSPTSPAYTIFENSGGISGNIHTKEALKEHLVILLAGRVAEEQLFGISITTGAINDFEEAHKLAEKMVLYYGMGKKPIYPQHSDAYKKIIDDEVFLLLEEAYTTAKNIIMQNMNFIIKGAKQLFQEKIIHHDGLVYLLQSCNDTENTEDCIL